jgi:glycosyltransferase involved in cell wall biosynthesis
MNQSIILITSGFPYGNSETFVEGEIPYLADSFVEVIIFCPIPTENIRREIPDNCKVITYDINLKLSHKLKAIFGIFSPNYKAEMKYIKNNYAVKASFDVRKITLISLFQAKRLCKKIQTSCSDILKVPNTILYSYWCDDSAIALSLLKKNNNHRLKIISRVHGWDLYFNIHKIEYLPFRGLIASKMNLLLPISSKGMNIIEEIWKVKNVNLKVSRLGVAGSTIGNKKNTETMDNSKLTIVSCSNLIPLKRVHLIAETLNQMNTPTKWIHFGDGPELKRVKNILVNNQNHETVFFGRVENKIVLEYYSKNKIDLFLNLSTTEGIPVSIMEAFSFGIPVVATNVGGTAEIVNPENGFLLPENPSVNDIKIAIENVIYHVEKRNRAYQTWKEKYNAEKNYADFVKLIQEI